MKAFENFKVIQGLESLSDQQEEWLKDYEGLQFGVAINKKHNFKWKEDPHYYDSEKFSDSINLIGRKKDRLHIEFDGDGKKAKEDFETTKQKLKEMSIGFIHSTHNSEKSDYLWVEFNRDLTTQEAKNFLCWVAPEGSEVDLNFTSDNKIYPVLFAKHWKYSQVYELPVDFHEGEQIDYDSLNCPEVKTASETRIGVDGFPYETMIKYSEEEYQYAIKNFKEKNLLELVHKELSNSHIGDNDLKMTNFLVNISALLKNPKRRMSMAITGNSSEGKDNLIKTCLKHIPRNAFIFLTSGTQATIEDDIQDKRIIAFSEVNAGRENGANKYLIEIIKQKTEGGTSSVKKDIRDGMKTARHEKGEQCCVLYGTTESDMDEEMKTRFIKGTIENDPVRIKKVNENTLDTFSDLNLLLNDSEEEDSWLRIGLTYFFNQEEQPEVYIPYAKYLKESVEGVDIFDHNNARSQRDIKRVLALTCAMTYLNQEQREIIEHNGKKVLVSEPQDLINTLKIASKFFNQTYTGLDVRLSKVLSFMKKQKTEWVARDDIQEELGVTRNTIKSYCQTLAGEGCLKGINGKELNFQKNTQIYNSNKIYYQRYQKGIKKELIRCQLDKLREFLETKTNKQIDTFIFPCNSDDKKGINLKVSKKVSRVSNPEKVEENSQFLEENGKIDTFSLTPLAFSKEDFKKAGYSEEETIKLLEDSK